MILGRLEVRSLEILDLLIPKKITLPSASKPLLPALPAHWWYFKLLRKTES